MKKKVLFTATVDSHILHFHIPYLKLFKEKGYEVHVATNGETKIPYCDVRHTIQFERSPFNFKNAISVFELKKVIDFEEFDIIHTHTPMGGVVTRLASIKSRKKGARVIYTAHGFHFFKGAPFINWMLYYPIEKILSYYTDDIITINMEDFKLAEKKFKTKIHYVPGVGVDEKKFAIDLEKSEIRKIKKELGFVEEDIIIICVAELNKNKNQEQLINAMPHLLKENKNYKLLLVGIDSNNCFHQNLINKLQLNKYIKLTGYRNDVVNMFKVSDIAVSASKREGLPVNLIEAKLSKLPVIASNCRGNIDLADIIYNNDKELIEACLNYKKIQNTKNINIYNISNVLNEVEKIYNIK